MAPPVNIFGGEDIENRTGASPRLVKRGTQVKVYKDRLRVVEVTSFVDTAGNPITGGIVSTERSQLPYFGTTDDDQNILWVDLDVFGSPTPIYALGTQGVGIPGPKGDPGVIVLDADDPDPSPILPGVMYFRKTTT